MKLHGSSFSFATFFAKYEVLIKYTLVPSIPLSIIAILSTNPHTWVTSEIHHFYIELIAVILAAVLAFYYISRARSLNDKFSLFVGIGFLASAMIDLLHVLVSYFAISDPVFLKYFIPQTWFAGRIFLSSMLVMAIAKYSTLSREDEVEEIDIGPKLNYAAGQYQQRQKQDIGEDQKLQKTVKVYTIILAVMAGSFAISSLFLVFPASVVDNFPIHRPYEIPPLSLFIIALVYFYKRHLYEKKDLFYKGILGYLTVDIFSQIIMTYSATSFDTAHNVAHVLKDAGYFVNIIALALSSIQYNVSYRAGFKRLQEKNAIIQMQYEKLKESDRMKDEFINIAAHELRTPIQPILGLADFLYSKAADNTQRELLDVVIRNAKRLKRLTDNVLDITKIESKSLKLNKRELNLNILMSEILKEYAGKIVISNEKEESKHKRLHVQEQQVNKATVKVFYEYRHKHDIFVEVDKNRLAQVLSNLLSNAHRSITRLQEQQLEEPVEEGGKVQDRKISIIVDTRKIEEKEEVIVGVKDTGEGIDPIIFPKIFSKFVSAADSGTGLGLYISKSIIEAHGGQIWAENNKKDNVTDGKQRRGATFYFSLPVIDNSIPPNTQEIDKQQEQTQMHSPP